MYYVYIEIPKVPTRRAVIISGGFDVFRCKENPFVAAKIADAIYGAQSDFTRGELMRTTRVFATQPDDHEAEEFYLPLDLFFKYWEARCQN